MITVTRTDVLRNQIVAPGWYKVQVKSVSTNPAKSDGSTNYIFKLMILEDSSGNAEYNGIQTKDFLINEKGLFGTGLAFLVACGFPKEELEKIRKGEASNAQVDENACVDKVIKAFVANTKYENRVSNECTDFLSI